MRAKRRDGGGIIRRQRLSLTIRLVTLLSAAVAVGVLHFGPMAMPPGPSLAAGVTAGTLAFLTATMMGQRARRDSG